MIPDKKILHISTDEKFIDMALRTFETVSPNNNKLIVISNNKRLKHVTYFDKLILTKSELGCLSKNIDFWKEYDIAIFHSLCTANIYIPPLIKTVWLGFGFDYYDLIPHKSKFLGDDTMKIVKSSRTIKDKLIVRLKSISLWNTYKRYKKRQFINRMDYFCPVLTDEYSLINWNKLKKPILIDWNYGTLEDDWAKIGNKHILTGRNILLGNSATYSCNHIEGLNALKNIDLKESKIIIPLSYGNKKYANAIKEAAFSMYSHHMLFLDSYMGFDSYADIVASCSNVIMPHKRQQGLGNILMSLFIGAKIFLDKENPVYTYLKSNNIIVFTLDDINQKELSTYLLKEEIKNNQDALFKIWSRNIIIEKTIKLVNI